MPEETVTSEREIYANSDEVLSKPEQAREKIVDGMLNKRFFAAQVLNEQLWIHDTTKTVGQALADDGRRGARVRALRARRMTRSRNESPRERAPARPRSGASC